MTVKLYIVMVSMSITGFSGEGGASGEHVRGEGMGWGRRWDERGREERVNAITQTFTSTSSST